MHTSLKQSQRTFFASDIAVEILEQLAAMECDPAYVTKSSYDAVSKTDVSFSDKHFLYMSTHQNIQPRDYLNNLRLKTKLR